MSRAWPAPYDAGAASALMNTPRNTPATPDAAAWARLSPLLDEALDLPPAERAAWLAAPFEECSTAGPWWLALEAARAIHLTAWFAHRATTRPAPAPRPSLAGTTPLGLLLQAAR